VNDPVPDQLMLLSFNIQGYTCGCKWNSYYKCCVWDFCWK